jgi:hypothetical protein
VHALEGAEEILGIASIEAGAVVAHEEDALAVRFADTDLDARRLARPVAPMISPLSIRTGLKKLS